MHCQWARAGEEPAEPREGERNVMSCDYNGWNDAPEEEREWFDQHPEIWGGPARDSDGRPFKLMRQAPHRVRRQR